MTDPTKQYKSWSGYNKMEGEDGVRTTLDCLRGRLLAERQASRVAKEDAELMGNKLTELENKIREETRLRRKAERKLKFLKNKLESLRISLSWVGSERSSSPDNSGFYFTSSSSTGLKESKSMSQSTSQLNTNNMEASVHDASVSTESDYGTLGTTEISIARDTLASINTAHNEVPQDKSSISVVEMETDARNESDMEENSLVLMAAAPTKTSEMKIGSQNVVIEVLEALRHAGEKKHNPMETKHIVRVCPT